jgi:hypothetical protein
MSNSGANRLIWLLKQLGKKVIKVPAFEMLEKFN